MNPFELSGPAFLGFYLVLAIAVTITMVVLRRRLGPDGPPDRRISDPYDIALLREGPVEAVRVAALALIGRRALLRSDQHLIAAAGAASADDLESAILSGCSTAIAPHRVPGLGVVRIALDRRRERLAGLGLAPDGATRGLQAALGIAAAVVLGAVAFGKIAYATAHGHNNIGFLMMLGIIAAIVAIGLGRRAVWATPRGRATLGLLRQMFAPLRGQRFAAKPDERTFLAAVYGTGGLSGADLAMWRQFNPPRPEAGGSSCGSSSGCGSASSCSSSSSCSSGCGSSGCGGCGS